MAQKQLKITLSEELAEAFRKNCADSGYSMTGKITTMMRTFLEEPDPVKRKENEKAQYSSRGKRRRRVKNMITELRDILECEELYLSNIPYNLQSGSFFENAEQSVSVLEEVIELLGEAY